ncbi:MAG: hypothetical protein F4Y44_03290, partial [Chloroflexi bacterium]|nr:hypothetical protein [Chloroflexota bacterium]
VPHIPMRLMSSFARWMRMRAARLAADPYRLMFHFSPQQNVMNDPNGLCFRQGRWHLSSRLLRKALSHAIALMLNQAQILPLCRQGATHLCKSPSC